MDPHLTWESLFVQFRRLLCAYAYRLTRNAAIAEDLVQEAFVRAIGSGHEPDQLKAPVAYVRKTMRNIVVDYARKSKGFQFESLDDVNNVDLQKQLPIVDSTIQRDLEDREIHEAIRLKSGRLSPREKRLLELLLEGKTCADISEIFGEDIRIIRSDVNALKAKLRYRYNQWKKYKGK